MSVEQNKTTLRRLYDEAWNKGNMSAVPDLVSPDYLYHGPQRDFKGPDGYKDLVMSQRTVFPDIHYTIDEIVGEGDKLAYRVSVRGTYKGKLGDIDITGKKFAWTQGLFIHFKDGKCAGALMFVDSLALYQQAGVAPPGFELAKK